MKARTPWPVLTGLLFVIATQPVSAGISSCSKDGFCYCIHETLADRITQRVAEIRTLIAAQRAQGKAIGYLSIPLSTLGGGYFAVNALVAVETKDHIEQQLGPRDVWILNPGATDFVLPADADGADYMWMWTQVLEGTDGLGAFDFVYFTGPSDFARHFGLDGRADLEKLDTAYDNLVKTKPEMASKVDKRAFRDYYGLRASVSFSVGSHDEWNIVRAINAKRRDGDKVSGIAKQMGVFFDGKPAAPGLFEASIDAGNSRDCNKN
ncbi:hypothetical protein [Bradyrhizobium sp. STM 3557]|uniref:hypothetical protein n=1 Tax=Bradyrhizobium sp. STM 3557 TaxID=578920 RepID=UPI00388EF13E